MHAAFVLSFRNAFALRAKHPRLPFILRTNLGVLEEGLFGRGLRPAKTSAVCFFGQHRNPAKFRRVICGLAAALPRVAFLVPNTMKNSGFGGCPGHKNAIALNHTEADKWASCSVQLDISWGSHVTHHTNTKTIIAAANRAASILGRASHLNPRVSRRRQTAAFPSSSCRPTRSRPDSSSDSS